jgi:hypothetical protein
MEKFKKNLIDYEIVEKGRTTFVKINFTNGTSKLYSRSELNAFIHQKKKRGKELFAEKLNKVFDEVYK